MSALRPDRPIPWRARPLLGVAACVALGVMAAQHFLGVGFWGWVALTAAAAIGGLFAGAAGRRRIVSLRRLTLTACCALAFVGLGGARMAGWSHLPPHHVAHLAAEADAMAHPLPLTLVGRVAAPPDVSARRVRLVVEAEGVGMETLVPTGGRVEVTLWQPRDPPPPFEPGYPPLRAGQTVAVEGLLRPLPPRRNPADFDYGGYLRRQGLHATLSASDPADVQILGYAPTPSERVVTAARAYIGGTLQAHVRDDEARAVLQALLLADRSGLDRETRDRFARTGLAHLLAVSGLHVFFVGMLLYGLLKPVLHRLGWSMRRVEVIRAVLVFGLLGGYVAVVGAPTSAVRALVMAALLIGARTLERPANGLNGLGAAALVLLLLRPAALFDVGFQLSFTAVGGLILLVPPLERRLPEGWMRPPVARYLLSLTLASTAATLATAPVLLFHFGQVPLAGLLLNLPAIPLTALTLGGSLLTVATAGWAPTAAGLAGASAELFASLLLRTGAWGEHWLGWTAVGGYVRSGWGLAALAGGVLALAWMERPRLRWRTGGVVLACGAVGLWLPLLATPPAPSLDALFLDVGQGDAVLLRLPNGRHVLVDAGPRDPYADAGERVLLPHLERFGIGRLDAVVVTHPHADHLGGVAALLRAGAVGRVVHNGDGERYPFHEESERLATAAGVPFHAVTAGDTLALDPAVRLYVLHPSPPPEGSEPDVHANDASVVLLVRYGETSLLLTGDVEAGAEAALVTRYGELLCADAVKVPHHGSRTSSTPAFVEAAAGCGRTAFAVAQVARRNGYGLPNEEALARWRGAGAEVLTTAGEGAIWLRSDGREVSRVRWR